MRVWGGAEIGGGVAAACSFVCVVFFPPPPLESSTRAPALVRGWVLDSACIENACVHGFREPKRYALPMQCWLLKQRFATYISAMRDIVHGHSSSAGVILDRSVSGQRHPLTPALGCSLPPTVGPAYMKLPVLCMHRDPSVWCTRLLFPHHYCR